MLRSCLRAVDAISRIPDAESVASFKALLQVRPCVISATHPLVPADALLFAFNVGIAAPARAELSFCRTRCAVGCWLRSLQRCSRSGQRRQAPQQWTCHSTGHQVSNGQQMPLARCQNECGGVNA